MNDETYHIEKYIEQEFRLSCPDNAKEDWLEALSERINDLMLRDFNSLLVILYRLDISESKIRQLLNEGEIANAGKSIARLIIERQIQKVKIRKSFRRNDRDIDENEKW